MARTLKRRKGLRPIKRIRLFLILLALLVLLTEALSFAAFTIVQRRVFSYSRIFAERRGISKLPDKSGSAATRRKESHGAPRYVKNEVLHPYLGYVFSPSGRSSGINEHGFLAEPGAQKRSDDTLIVAVFGGSVAQMFCSLGAETLGNELASLPCFKGKKVVFVEAAIGGYKQPQQLFTLNYFLLLGSQFDLAINIDGFNEVALSLAENVPKKVSPMFPRNWFLRVLHQIESPAIRRIMGKIAFLKERRRKLAVLFSSKPACYSVTVNLIWKFIDIRKARQIVNEERNIVEFQPEERQFIHGPFPADHEESDLLEDVTAVWRESSVLMHRLCEASGIRYYHFLQPNQYVDGSKKMGAKERRRAVSEAQPFRRPARIGYPHLIASANTLRDQGVRFHDLTMIFKDVEEELYTDDCCHFNARGNEIMASAIFQAIRADFDPDGHDGR